jgi:hypothetical protein
MVDRRMIVNGCVLWRGWPSPVPADAYSYAGTRLSSAILCRFPWHKGFHGQATLCVCDESPFFGALPLFMIASIALGLASVIYGLLGGLSVL